jgi:hypothetical protein
MNVEPARKIPNGDARIQAEYIAGLTARAGTAVAVARGNIGNVVDRRGKSAIRALNFAMRRETNRRANRIQLKMDLVMAVLVD